MKSNFLKSALALLICIATVLSPAVTAFAAGIPMLNLDENGGCSAPAEEPDGGKEASDSQDENTADKNQIATYEAGETVSVTLEKAPETSFKKLSAEWPSFRYDSDNNGVISAKAPTTANDAVLYWAKKIGDGYSTGAASSPIIVDGYIYCYAGTNIFKVDKISGEIVASAKMVGNSSFSIVPPTYADGMLFVGLSNGRIQAFDAC